MSNHTQPEEEEPASGHPGFSLRSIARTVWKRKFCIVAAWILLSLVTVGVVRRLPAVYLAESLILVDSQKIPEKFVSATVDSDLEARISAIRQQILSSGELKKIINEYGLYQKERKTRFEEEILDLMRRDISIDLVLGSSANNKRPGAFRIGYQGPDPALVARVANRLTDLYVEQNSKTREAQAEGTSEFLDTQLREAKNRLDELEAAVSAYKLKHNGELPQQEASLASALAGLHTRLQANLDAISRAQQTKIIQESALNAMESSGAAQVRALQPGRRATDAPGAAGAQAATTAPQETVEALQGRLEVLLAQYKDDYPEVINLRAAIEAAKRAEERQQARELALSARPPASAGDPPSTAAPEPVELARTREQIASMKAQIKVAEAEIANRTTEQQRILREIDQYQSRIERLPVREQEMARIMRDYEMSKENYKSLMDKQMSAAMSLDMEKRQQSERFTVLDRARTPEKPVKPKRPMLYALGSVAGLALGLLLGFGIELRHNVFLGEWELPDGIPVLARLPYFEVAIPSSAPAPQSGGKSSRRNQGLATASSLLLCLPAVLAGGLRSWFDRL